MKYLITVLFSCIISLHTSMAYAEVIIDGQSKCDSICRFELLKLEYKFFSAQKEEEKYEALMDKVKLNFFNKAYADAINEIKRIEQLNNAVLIKHSYYNNMAKLLFQHALYNDCLDMMNSDSLNYTIEKSFLKALCLNELGEIEIMKNEIRHCALIFNKDTSFVINQFESLDLISTQKLSVLYQALIPGAGMVREGELKEGLTSFLLNGIFITAPLLLIKQQLFVSAFSYGVMPLSKFYFGGIRHTKYLAQINLEKKLKAIKQKNAAVLFQFYKS